MTDEELVGRYRQARDPSDFRELVDRHASRVHRLVSSVLGPFRHMDAEETSQDTFVRAHEKLEQFRGEASFATWLLRIAWSVALNRTKSARIRLPHVPIDALSPLLSGDDPQRDLLDAERVALVAEAVETLPDLYRTAIYLHYWQGAPVSEIAASLAVPENTVKSYLLRGRERLGRELVKKGLSS
jgi:RNA polymerase sigma-70 factor (ECF subfamily)